MEKPKDRDFLETLEGLLFCVIGYLHPPDRYTSYLKYAPTTKGKWNRGVTKYSRVAPGASARAIENTNQLLKEFYPQYLFECPVMNIPISSVSRDRVKTYYKPRNKLISILNKGPIDVLEYKLIDLVSTLCSLTGLSWDDFGVTGSILTNSHNSSFSDIDLTVYGRDPSRKLREALIESSVEKIRRLQIHEMEDRSRRVARQYPLSFDDIMLIHKRQWNYGLYDDTHFSVHPVRQDEEIIDRYGDRIYRQQGVVTGTAKIAKSKDAMFLPSIYQVEDVEIDPFDVRVEEIISFEGIFSDVFEKDEHIRFKGMLEKITNGKEQYRIVIGYSGQKDGFIKISSDQY